jgi:hypothetical protein
MYCCWVETDVIDMNESQKNRRTANAICEGPKTNKLNGVELGYNKVSISLISACLFRLLTESRRKDYQPSNKMPPRHG